MIVGWFWDSEAWMLIFVTPNKWSYLRRKNLEKIRFNHLVLGEFRPDNFGFYNFLILGSFTISFSVWICYEFLAVFMEFFSIVPSEKELSYMVWTFPSSPKWFCQPWKLNQVFSTVRFLGLGKSHVKWIFCDFFSNVAQVEFGTK